MKQCSKCKKLLDESKFNWKYKYTKLQYHCKDCSRKYIQKHYKNNISYYILKAKKRNETLREKAHSFIGPYLLSHPCIDCGEKDILVLEFDHKNRKVKDGEISHIIQSGASLTKIKSEIDKCEVRCSNCHRRKTEKENKSWKLKYISTCSSTG